jgi:hypothetical protein
MEAGRKLDAIIHEKVFGKKSYWVGNEGLKQPYPVSAEKLPCYSTDISAAWSVAEKIWSMPPNVQAIFEAEKAIPSAEVVTNFSRPMKDASINPLAICLAALKAVRGD